MFGTYFKKKESQEKINYNVFLGDYECEKKIKEKYEEYKKNKNGLPIFFKMIEIKKEKDGEYIYSDNFRFKKKKDVFWQDREKIVSDNFIELGIVLLVN